MTKPNRAPHQNPYQEVKAILNVAKKLLKEKKLSYADLAKHWHLSLPAVKAAMNSDNLPLARVLSLCELLEINLKDLCALLVREAGKEVHFTQEQEAFFAKNPTYLAYFFALARKTPDEIEKAHGISRRSSRLYLKTLEKMGLVKQLSGDRVKPRGHGPVIWSDQGPLGATFSKAMLLDFARHAAAKITQPGKMHLELHGWTLTPEQYGEARREYEKLARKYREVSALNRQILPQGKREETSFLVLGDYWECAMFSEIRELA